jgi:hemerythrin-like metal-binding protein
MQGKNMEIQVEIFPWNTNFETQIELIDEQHKQLVHLLNVLVEHLAFQSDAPTIDKIFEQLKDYVAFHFASEEAIWQEHFHGDPWENWHKLAHVNFVTEVNNIREQNTDKSYDEIVEQIVQFLTHWLAQHILDSDKRMAKVVLALPSGVSLARAKEIANDEMTGVSKILIETIMSMYDKLASSALQMTREIKKRQQAEIEMQRAKEAADAANRAKSEFIATMSHELRTPLNAILGFSELMALDESLSGKHKEILTIINRSGEHLLKMINGVLDISKIEAGCLELEIKTFDLPKLLHDISDMIQMRTRNKHLGFRLELSNDVPQYIQADSGKLRQVLINLLGNAIKFTQQGQITLRIQASPAVAAVVELEIEVIDSGAGIPEDKLEVLFQPFVQLSQANAETKGSGLGLAISKSLVELMGGQISVCSQLGAGSTFKIVLPVPVATAEQLHEEDTHQVKSLTANQPQWRLLVVDDNADNRLLLQTMLTQVGFQVTTANNGQEAIDNFIAWQPHLILMDMRMPVMDGYQATAKIRQLPGGEQVKIIAVTASAFQQQHESILNTGCDAIIHKPFQACEVFAALSQYLGVDFIYQQPSDPSSSTHLKLTADMLNPVPLALKAQLYAAASNLDIDETDAVITQIQTIAPEIAKDLQQLAQNFQFAELAQLFETANA